MKIRNSKFEIRNLLVSVFVLTACYLLLATSALAAGATLSLSPASGTFNQGCSFSMDVLLDTGGIPTDGTDAILFYDPTRFNVTKIRSGTIYSDYPGNTIDAQNGKISMHGLASISSAFTGQGVLASIDFTIPQFAPTGATQINFDFDPNDKAKTTDSNVVERTTVADVLNQVNNGSYTVGTGNCNGVSVSPTVTPVNRGGSSGQPGQGETQPAPSFEPKPLPQSADFNTTVVVASVGAMLIILGILGLALL